MAAAPATALSAQAAADPVVRADMTGKELYDASCANCHGADGTGLDRLLVGFEEPLPDFSDCAFASREPDGDWVGVAHQGGPLRGFSKMMPAFGGVLTEDQLQSVMDYIRGFCGNDAWPRGELNLPRALFTEKAYPEDEWVIGSSVDLEDAGAVQNEFVYEKRYGARSQIEIVIPWTFQERQISEGDGWVAGLNDIVLGVKHALYHSADRGHILSLAGEVKLPTGDEDEGFGAGDAILEAFASFGQILPADAFIQAQVGIEDPMAANTHREGFWRGVFGKTFTQANWGRAWTPMVELLGKRELVEGEETTWDIVPQVQVSLNQRQHVLFNAGVLLPLTDSDTRNARLVAYLLLDWFDGGFFEGW